MQQHGSKYYARRHPLTLGMGSIGHNSSLSEYSHVAYHIKENHKCSNMVANNLPADPPPRATLGMGSEHGHVEYHIKGNFKCSNMVANILHANPPPPGP